MTDGMLAVGGFHVGALVKIGPTGDKCDEGNLTRLLFVHVSVGKVVGNSWVLEHDIVELVDDRDDGFGLTESFVEGHQQRFGMSVKIKKIR